jgi:A/G-specific adenine glycosylase
MLIAKPPGDQKLLKKQIRNQKTAHLSAVTEVKKSVLVVNLLKWYDKNARDLPWRRTSDPYAIWVSEIMLQQTQVKTAIPYWQRWMDRFPNLRALALAEPETVLKHWEGLGYYRRARMLHSAARILAEHSDGRFPEHFEEILNLPGVGCYTAGAIASIAFNQPKPIVDGNVVRVFARIERLNFPFKSNEDYFWSQAESLISIAARNGSSRSCARFNQSLMELGATVCLPRNPLCEKCPINDICSARKHGDAEHFPVVQKREKMISLQMTALTLHHAGSFLMERAEAQAWNAGLWQFPTRMDALYNQFPEKLLENFRNAERKESVLSVPHVITRHRIQLKVYLANADRRFDTASLKPEEYRWVPIWELGSLAMSSAHRKIANFLLGTSSVGAMSFK